MPKLEQLNSLGCMTNMNLVLTKQNLLHMELLLLETFQWNLCLPTAAHFIEYYLSEAVHETDLHDGWPMISLGKINSTCQVCRLLPGSIFARLCLLKLCIFFSSCCTCGFFKDYTPSFSSMAYETALSYCLLLGFLSAVH